MPLPRDHHQYFNGPALVAGKAAQHVARTDLDRRPSSMQLGDQKPCMGPHLRLGPCQHQEEQLPVPCSIRAQVSVPRSCGKAALKQDCTGVHVNTNESSCTAAPELIGTPLVRHDRLPRHPFGPTFGFSVLLRRSHMPNRYLTVLSTLQAPIMTRCGQGSSCRCTTPFREAALWPSSPLLITPLCTSTCG